MNRIVCNNCEETCNIAHLRVELVTDAPTMSDDLEEKHFCAPSCLVAFFTGKIGAKGG